MSEVDNSRRQLLQRIAYTAPMIATLAVMPSIASAGSTFNRIKRNNGVGNGPDCLPPGLEKNGKTFLDNVDDVFQKETPMPWLGQPFHQRLSIARAAAKIVCQKPSAMPSMKMNKGR
jgi:hypothetical protein